MKQGFTLIELLIVVAIIAILAAIAVPNFLEAQTRSKSSGAHSEMRTLSVALNVYHIDTGKFPPQPDIIDTGERRMGLAPLTTPIAYMTSLPNDPFSTEDGKLRQIYYVDIAKNPTFPAGSRDINKYVLGSVGPDSQDQFNDVIKDLIVDGFTQIYESGIYDPTNGTFSHGDLVRTNCSMLGGAESSRW